MLTKLRVSCNQAKCLIFAVFIPVSPSFAIVTNLCAKTQSTTKKASLFRSSGSSMKTRVWAGPGSIMSLLR
jgi:hypothetical protein